MATTVPPFKYRPRKKRPVQTYREYIERWELESYRKLVRAKATKIGSDGCSGVADFFVDVCYEHDIHYATHKDLFTHAALTKEDADRYLKWGIQFHSVFGRRSPMAWWRHRALSKKKGLGLGANAWETGPERMKKYLALADMRRDFYRGSVEGDWIGA